MIGEDENGSAVVRDEQVDGLQVAVNSRLRVTTNGLGEFLFFFERHQTCKSVLRLELFTFLIEIRGVKGQVLPVDAFRALFLSSGVVERVEQR